MITVFVDQPTSQVRSWIEQLFGPGQYSIIANSLVPHQYAFLTDLKLSTEFTDFEEKQRVINRYCDNHRQVFVVETELNDSIARLIKSIDKNNLCWVIPGMVPGKNNTVFYGWHQEVTADLYKQLPTVLENINPYTVKDKVFDCLLGTRKIHRDFVYTYLKYSNLFNKSIITYHGYYNATVSDPEHFIWADDCSHIEHDLILPDGTKKRVNEIEISTGPVSYHGRPARLSHIIPVQVYNNTAYSIVCETFYDNAFNFYTEKIAKPMLARRMFVVFTSCGYLKNLRSLGFETFGDIIDESYDLIEDNTERWDQACRQLKRLSQLDQAEVFERIQHRCQHNYELTNNLGQITIDRLKKQLR
jgi:hypothetical protein